MDSSFFFNGTPDIKIFCTEQKRTTVGNLGLAVDKRPLNDISHFSNEKRNTCLPSNA